ncbi:hypothetical protein HPB51_020101 [Rhipicephalus microplus]|uniref:Uncharacterized protein n=1 Tax=Rhipicephalus microplus TaxID=6941 RepID=A0A9J6EJ05_RHIMP|nr:hypothetical protein HPB51_020101 [Rhipicephalus microplus]
MSSKTLARHASFYDICEVVKKECCHPYSEEEESQRELSTCEERAGDADAVTGFDKLPIGLEPDVRAASAREERAGDVDAVTCSDKPLSSLDPGVGRASSKTPTSNTKQAEAKESEPSASSEFHGITMSEEQYTSLLQSLNLPIHSKPITNTQLEKEAERPCICSRGQQPQTPQPSVPQHKIALQTPTQQLPAAQMSVQQTPVPVVPAQQTPRYQTTTVLAATEVPTVLTSTLCWTIEHDQQPPLGSGGAEEVITARARPAAARKLTYDSVPVPASMGAAEESPVLSVTAA